MSEVTPRAQPVVITDFEMPFWSLVIFLVKLAVAAIPAIVILAVMGAILTAVLGGIFGGLHGH